MDESDRELDRLLRKYRIGIFEKLKVTSSGLPAAEKAAIRQLVNQYGGQYYGEMDSNVTTHLVIRKPTGVLVIQQTYYTCEMLSYIIINI